jgi:hypothetical protein
MPEKMFSAHHQNLGNKSKASTHGSMRKSGDNAGTFQFVDQRPSTVVQRQIQAQISRLSPQPLVHSLPLGSTPTMDHPSTAIKQPTNGADAQAPIQMVKYPPGTGKGKGKGGAKKAVKHAKMPKIIGKKITKKKVGDMKRPAFNARVKKLAKHAKTFAKKDFDMAHKVPYDHIKKVLLAKGNPALKKKLIHAVCVPQRDHGPIKKGDKSLLKQVESEKDPKKQVKMVNSSIFNLRPGEQGKNRSIGAGTDYHFVQKGKTRSLSPQSRRMHDDVLKDQGRSSDFMTEAERKKFESQF